MVQLILKLLLQFAPANQVAIAPDEPETEQDEAERLASAAEAVRRRMEQGQTQKDAVKAVSAETGVKKNALYRYVLDHEE